MGAGVAGMLLLRTIRPSGDTIEDRRLLDDILATDGPRHGPDDADLRVALYTDYRCPVCRASHAPMLAAAGRAGVLLLFRDWPVLGAASLRAARIAVAADAQGRYMAVHDALMRAPSIDEPSIARAVAAAGADWPLAAAGADGAAVTARIQRNVNQAFALGLRGTPGYLAGPIRVQGGMDEAGFTALFERARREWRRLA